MVQYMKNIHILNLIFQAYTHFFLFANKLEYMLHAELVKVLQLLRIMYYIFQHFWSTHFIKIKSEFSFHQLTLYLYIHRICMQRAGWAKVTSNVHSKQALCMHSRMHLIYTNIYILQMRKEYAYTRNCLKLFFSFSSFFSLSISYFIVKCIAYDIHRRYKNFSCGNMMNADKCWIPTSWNNNSRCNFKQCNL